MDVSVSTMVQTCTMNTLMCVYPSLEIKVYNEVVLIFFLIMYGTHEYPPKFDTGDEGEKIEIGKHKRLLIIIMGTI